VWVIAHRGASSDRTENTFAAFDEALAQGCDAIETDLRLTRDDVVVVFHDRTLERAGGGGRAVRATDRAELARLDRAVPTLDELLERYGMRTRLLLELKTDGVTEDVDRLVHAAAETVSRRGLVERVLVLSYEPSVLEAVARVLPAAGRVLNVSAETDPGPAPAGCFALSVDVVALDTPHVAAMRRTASLPLFVFTCNREEEVERALAADAAGIMSDRPGWLRRDLDRRTRRE
jgi:glycerophosphoryl diester phosphodiesterase